MFTMFMVEPLLVTSRVGLVNASRLLDRDLPLVCLLYTELLTCMALWRHRSGTESPFTLE